MYRHIVTPVFPFLSREILSLAQRTGLSAVLKRELFDHVSPSLTYLTYRLGPRLPTPPQPPPNTAVHTDQDMLILVPLKLALFYLLLPSMMRHRMRSEMFTRIPRHAPSVQIARRRPDLQVGC